jgi:hypothetical protein
VIKQARVLQVENVYKKGRLPENRMQNVERRIKDNNSDFCVVEECG